MPELDQITYVPVAKFQTSRRDIAFILDTSFSKNDVTVAIKEINKAIVDVELFDTYTNPTIGSSKHSLAYHIYYQSFEKTLTSDEIQAAHQEVENYVKEHYHATIR